MCGFGSWEPNPWLQLNIYDQKFFSPGFYKVDLFLVLSWSGDMSKILNKLNLVCYFTPDLCLLSFTSHDNSKELILKFSWRFKIKLFTNSALCIPQSSILNWNNILKTMDGLIWLLSKTKVIQIEFTYVVHCIAKSIVTWWIFQ